MFLFRKRPPLTIILRAELLHLPVTLLSPWKSQISMLYQLAVLHFAFYLLYYIIFYLLIFCTVSAPLDLILCNCYGACVPSLSNVCRLHLAIQVTHSHGPHESQQ